MRHSHVVITALHSWCWRSRIILMTLLQVSAASLLFSDTSTMTQRLRSTISTIVDTPETLLFQLIPFCHTLHCRSRPCREGESERWPKKMFEGEERVGNDCWKTEGRSDTSQTLGRRGRLFFPSLVKENRPDDLFSPKFGWCLGCSDPHQFFSNRFLHVLLLRLAFTFSLASRKRSLSRPWRQLVCPLVSSSPLVLVVTALVREHYPVQQLAGMTWTVGPFRSLLSTSQQAILSSQPSLSLKYVQSSGSQVAHCKSWPSKMSLQNHKVSLFMKSLAGWWWIEPLLKEECHTVSSSCQAGIVPITMA